MLFGGPVLFWYAAVAKRRAETGIMKQVTTDTLLQIRRSRSGRSIPVRRLRSTKTFASGSPT